MGDMEMTFGEMWWIAGQGLGRLTPNSTHFVTRSVSEGLKTRSVSKGLKTRSVSEGFKTRSVSEGFKQAGKQGELPR